MKKVKVSLHMNERFPGIIYALVYDKETGQLEISATLEYCLESINKRNWFIVK